MRKKIIWYHLLALIIGIIIAMVCIRHLIAEDPSLIVSYRDISVPPRTGMLADYYFFAWSDQGSHPNYETLARSWYSFPMIFNDITLFSKIDFLFLYTIMFFVPYLAFFSIFHKYLKYDWKVSFLSSIVAAVLYSLNPYSVMIFSPPYTYVISYSFFPALVYAYLMVLEKNTHLSRLALALIITLVVTPILRAVVFVVAIMLLTSLSVLFIKGISRRSLRNMGLNLCIVLVMVVGINAYWLLPAISASFSAPIQPSYTLTYEMTHLFSTRYSFDDILLLRASWWPYLQLKPIIPVEIWLLLLLVIPLLSLSSLMLWYSRGRDEKLLLLTGVGVCLVGFSLWSGLNNPISSFSKLYELLLFSTPSSIGWMFRVPEYFGALVAFSSTLLAGLVIARIGDKCQKFNSGNRFFTPKRLFVGLLVLLLVSSGLIGWQRLSGDLDGNLRSGYHLAERSQFDVSSFQRPLVLLWNYTGDFQPNLIGKPFVDPPKDVAKYLVQTLRNGDNKALDLVCTIMGTDSLITNLEITNTTLVSICYLSNYDIWVYLLNPSNGAFQIRSNLASVHEFDSELYGFISTMNSSLALGTESELKYSHLVINPNPISFMSSSAKATTIDPFLYTIHHDPSRLWSRASTADPLHGEWHAYIDQFNLRNWQTDNGRGLVFTWANPQVPTDTIPSNNFLIEGWDFNNDTDLKAWQESTPNEQFGAIQELTRDQDSLRVSLFNSTWGWKTINSPSISAHVGIPYRFSLNTRGTNAHSVYVKVAELDADMNEIRNDSVGLIGNGTFGWKVFTVDFTPRNPSTAFIRLEFWHGNIAEAIPNRVWIDDVRVWNISSYTIPAAMSMNFEVDSSTDYRLFSRSFINPEGGVVEIQIDNRSVSLFTRDQLSRFVWRDLGILNLSEGRHTIALRNLYGLNAVNQIVVIPVAEYRKELDRYISGLKNKTLLYVFEGESEFNWINGRVIGSGNQQASNGMVLQFDSNGRAWQEVDVLRNGTYEILLRGSGNMTIMIDEREYEMHISGYEKNASVPIELEAGQHRIEIVAQGAEEKSRYIDFLCLYSVDGGSRLDDILAPSNSPAEIAGVRKINPTEYLVHVSAHSQYLLLFSESYDPLWVAQIKKDGHTYQYKPNQIDRLSSGFYINITGEYDISVRYLPQTWFESGIIVTLAVILGCLTYAYISRMRNRK